MKLNEIQIERIAGDVEEVQNYESGDLRLSYCNLTSLKGCPKEVTGNLSCHNNYLTSFEYFPKIIRDRCDISHNKFTSFKDIDKHIQFIGDTLFVNDNSNITSGFSDLFGIDGLKYIVVTNFKIGRIVNKYLYQKDLIEFQDEMIKSGYESYL